jgi:hypothetical protein
MEYAFVFMFRPTSSHQEILAAAPPRSDLPRLSMARVLFPKGPFFHMNKLRLIAAHYIIQQRVVDMSPHVLA